MGFFQECARHITGSKRYLSRQRENYTLYEKWNLYASVNLRALTDKGGRDTLLSQTLALKGGTAINLMIFDLPRLSVDIDLDFSQNLPRAEMLEQRRIITERISKYMAASGYTLSLKSKEYHALA